MRPSRTICALCCVLLALVAGVARSHGQAPQAQGSVFAARPALREVELSGFTRARAEMAIVAEGSGKAVEVRADVGDRIGKDGVFARLDATLPGLDLEKNRAEQARLESQAAYLDKETGRYRALVSQNTVARAALDKLEEDLSQAGHGLAALKVEEKRLREIIARQTIKAPAGWLVTARSVEPGQWVAAGTPVGVAGDFSTLIVPFALAPEELEALRSAGNPLALDLPDSAVSVPARIHSISPAFDPGTRKTQVELALADGIEDRRGGLRAVLDLSLPDPSGAVLVPEAGLEERYLEHWLTREDGSQVKVVRLGAGQDGLARVTAPEVRPGDRFRMPAARASQAKGE